MRILTVIFICFLGCSDTNNSSGLPTVEVSNPSQDKIQNHPTNGGGTQRSPNYLIAVDYLSQNKFKKVLGVAKKENRKDLTWESLRWLAEIELWKNSEDAKLGDALTPKRIVDEMNEMTASISISNDLDALSRIHQAASTAFFWSKNAAKTSNINSELQSLEISAQSINRMAVNAYIKSENGGPLDTSKSPIYFSFGPNVEQPKRSAEIYSSAGFMALQSFNAKKAIDHFLFALSLQPDHEWYLDEVVDVFMASDLLFEKEQKKHPYFVLQVISVLNKVHDQSPARLINAKSKIVREYKKQNDLFREIYMWGGNTTATEDALNRCRLIETVIKAVIDGRNEESIDNKLDR